MTIPNTGRESKRDAITWRLHLQGHVADGEPVIATWQFPGCRVLSQVAIQSVTDCYLYLFFFLFLSLFELLLCMQGAGMSRRKIGELAESILFLIHRITVGSSRWDPTWGRRVRLPRRRRTRCIARSLEVSGVSTKGGGGFPTRFHEAYLSTSRAVSVMMTLMANTKFWHPLFSSWIRPHIYLSCRVK